MTGRDLPGIFSNEHGTSTYESGTRRMSPSSWDSDSDEEDSDSYRGVTAVEINDSEDRRQSLPRLKRRKNVCKNWENYYMMPKPQPFRDRYDWDPDEIILDIENFLNDQSFVYSKPDSQSDNRGINNREGIDNFRNLSVRLSRILEVEESSMNFTMESSKVSPLKKGDKIYDFERQYGKCEVSGYTSKSSERSSANMYPVEENDFSSESNSDGSEGMWTRIRRIKKRNEELAATYQDDLYLNESLAGFFGGGGEHDTSGRKQGNRKDGMGKQNSALRESSANTKGDELSESFPAMMERKFDEDKISIDGVEDVRDCTALTDELETPKRDGNLTGKAMDHALFLESTRSGSGESSRVRRPMFPISPGQENSQHKISKDCTEIFQSSSPASRDTFLINQSVTSNKSNEFENSKKGIHQLGNQRLSSGLSEKFPSSPERDTSYKSIGSGRESLRSGDHGFNSLFDILLDLNGSDNDDKCSTVEMKIFGDSPSECCVTRGSSPVSGRVENEDRNPSSPAFKFSKTGKSQVNKSFRAENEDSSSNFYLLDYEQCDIGDNEWNTGATDSKETDQPQDRGDMKYENNPMKSEWRKLAMTLGEESKIKNKSTVFWIDLEENIRTDCFQNDSKRKILKPRSYITTNGSKRKTRSTASSVNLAQKRTQARKRKRESNIEPFISQSNHSSYLLHRKKEKNWFVKRFTLKWRKSTLGKGKPPESFLLTGRSYSSGTSKHLSMNHTSYFSDSSTFNCFRTLFKQLANAFTVSWHKIRNFTV